MRFRIFQPLSNLRFLLTGRVMFLRDQENALTEIKGMMFDLRDRFAEQQNALTEIKGVMFDLKDHFAEQQIMMRGRLENFFQISLQHQDIDTEMLATIKRYFEGQKGTIQVILEQFKDELRDLLARL